MRNTFFGDVHTAENFDTRNDRREDFNRVLHDFLQNAVDTETDAQIFFERLNMDVGRAAFNRVVDNLIDELYRRLVVERELFGFFHCLGLVVVIIIFHRGVHVGEVFNRRRKLHIRNDQRANFKPGHQMQVIDGDNVVRVFHGDIQGFVLLIERQNVVAQRHFGCNQVRGRNIDADFVNRHIPIAAFLRHDARNVIFSAVAELCQNTADERFAGFLNFQRFLRLRLCYDTGVNKPRTNTARK